MSSLMDPNDAEPAQDGVVGYLSPTSPPDGASLVRYFFPEYDDWRRILSVLGVSRETAIALAARATTNGTDFQTELVASGLVTEDAVTRAIAAEFGLRHVEAIDPEKLVIRERDCIALLQHQKLHVPVKMEERDGRMAFLVAPRRQPLRKMRGSLFKIPRALPRLRLTSPGTLRRAVLRKARPLLAANARNGLYERMPAFSARVVAEAWQGSLLGAMLAVLVFCAVFFPLATFVALHVFFSLFFLACVGLRFAAVNVHGEPPPEGLEATRFDRLPVYSVLVALHREAPVVPQLVAALRTLVWPVSKLDVKLVCEADDAETLAAIRAQPLPPHFEVIEVPAGQPRTKPKALAYALPVVRGEYVVLYDAEDQPHPHQLLEAWTRFSQSGPDLACLQAPLEIGNAGAGHLPRQFAFEYAALFRGLLPFLAGRQVLLPLGGTSNHLRVATLEEVGGWDPYNVTEDADLGIRLARFGYRTETIALPTMEDAPEELSVWIRQRTRWFKGWLQCWLVHMRSPGRLLSELGLASFIVAQILFVGLVISALIHPFLIVAAIGLAAHMMAGDPPTGWKVMLFTVDVINVLCGYLSFLLLGWHALKPNERRGFWRTVIFTPPYWMLLSVAAWRSVIDLYRRPHHWEKTPHRASRSMASNGETPHAAISLQPRQR